ncbi:MAG: hypothetical protein ACJ75B_20435 [Flavisolibacter sp.]
MTTDWTRLAKQIGSFRDDGSESGGDSFAQQAFDEIFGDEWIESTVEHIISFKGGRELAMNCLRYLHSTKAAKYAYHVYKTSDGERAGQAVWLIKHLANPIAFDWVEEFLQDENVIHWGIGVLDELLWTEQIPYDDKAKSLLDLAERSSNGQLKEQADFIRQYLLERNWH